MNELEKAEDIHSYDITARLLGKFGLYFTRNQQAGNEAARDLDPQRCSSGCQTWNAGRIYATVMLVVTCTPLLVETTRKSYSGGTERRG